MTRPAVRSGRARSNGARRPGVALLAAIALVLSLLPALTATADIEDDAKRVDEKLAAVSDDLVEANAEVAKAVAALNDAQAKLPAAQRELASAQRAETDANTANDRASSDLVQATEAAEAAEAERRQVESQIADLQGRVGNLAREVYQNGAFSDFDLLVTSDSPTELADRAAALDAVSRANNQTLAQMAAVRADLALKEARLQVLRDDVDQKKRLASVALVAAQDARRDATAAKARVDELVAARKAALATADRERKSVLSQYRSLRSEQMRIANLIAAEAARQANGDLGFTPTGSDGFTWPLAGARMTQDVGPRVHPVYGYRSCHTGVDLAAASGSPIHATAAGIVVSVASGGPYGNHSLIAHGNGTFSMYAHQSRVGVSVGQRVKAGEVIGYVGSTGYVTGPHLHFEIHIGSQPYNPMGWFGGARTPVTC